MRRLQTPFEELITDKATGNETVSEPKMWLAVNSRLLTPDATRALVQLSLSQLPPGLLQLSVGRRR